MNPSHDSVALKELKAGYSWRLSSPGPSADAVLEFCSAWWGVDRVWRRRCSANVRWTIFLPLKSSIPHAPTLLELSDSRLSLIFASYTPSARPWYKDWIVEVFSPALRSEFPSLEVGHFITLAAADASTTL